MAVDLRCACASLGAIIIAHHFIGRWELTDSHYVIIVT